jgi:hypothetical protein
MKVICSESRLKLSSRCPANHIGQSIQQLGCCETGAAGREIDSGGSLPTGLVG